jgi:hypothetical protein
MPQGKGTYGSKKGRPSKKQMEEMIEKKPKLERKSKMIMPMVSIIFGKKKK